MANKPDVAQEVAQLSQEQQDTIIKVGKRALFWQMIVAIPWLILMILGIFVLIDPPLDFDYNDYGKLYLGYLTLAVLGAAYLIGVLVFVKVKYPFYSDAKWRYINNMRKGK